MTLYENNVFDKEKAWMEVPDTEENILRDLELYTLDPVFEMYGDFVDRNPEWLSEKVRMARAGHTMISGNFLGYTHAFRVCTDDPGLIERLEAAINRNKASAEYQEARIKMLAKLPSLSTKGADVGKYYAFCGGWVRITEVIHMTEEQANEESLLYLDHWRGIDWNGHKVGGAFTDGRKISTTKNWKLNDGAQNARQGI